ncbi:MAG: cytochrome c oxidase cbb3-type subunit I [Puniceicoccaceae bacterium 5H]|nr:MAG: cytochrome c oxidase cbb3-type subunit I [Puniceicoccaceae bacterium 5H]
MSSQSPTLLDSLSPTAERQEALRARLSEVDRSMRTPGTFFVVAAVLWLMVGTLFALLTAIKFTNPSFLGHTEIFTFGRVRSAHLNSVIYGWATNAGFAVGLWIMARLCRTRVRHTRILMAGAVFWNLGVIGGIIGILKGDMVAVEWLEMPGYVTPLLAISFALIGVWAIIAFRWRQTDHVYVSQWYILAAFFWLPWLYTTAQILLVFEPAKGVVQSLTNWWFAHNVLGLWLTPLGLGTAYYLIPKVLGRPIYSYYLSVYGFWTLALFYNWAGVHHLIGGPVPAWVISAGTVASVMMVIPVVVVAVNHHMTVVGLHRQGWRSPTIRFIVFGAINYTIVSLIGSAMALRDVNLSTHFTDFTVGHAHHGLYAFYTMIMFGGMYYMLPRLLNREWPSAFLIKTHFWMTALGILLMVNVLQICGWIVGEMMNQVTQDGTVAYTFQQIVEFRVPWHWLRSVSGFMITIGHFAFFINVVWMLFRPSKADQPSQPTLLTRPTAEANA